MTQRQLNWIKLVLIIGTLVGVYILTLWLADKAFGASQPTTRDLDLRMAPDGFVYAGPDEARILPVGRWSGQTLATDRGERGRLRAIRSVTNGNEDLLFAYKRQPPTRSNTDEFNGFEVAAMEFPGSEWIPLSGYGRGWELDGGVIRIVVKVYARQR